MFDLLKGLRILVCFVKGLICRKGATFAFQQGGWDIHEDDEDDRRVPGRARLSVASASAPTC